ncbi:patatin-like phospholipase family protein [Shimia biformata]|uniref:patatin-like phospholipase family protein n=1 Tax=Shimia biformata TaxID=1294299 RepID=UPI00194F68B3|nr:patatin-like phospholipase family protein [Shimia biformata]
MGFFLTACAAVNEPINAPGQSADGTVSIAGAGAGNRDDVFVGLAFSGGGTRASAFAYGMLDELQRRTGNSANPYGVLTDVRLVSGVSGGSVTAAWFGYKGPAGLKGYRENYLLKDGEVHMANSAFNPVTIVKGLSGGANDRNTFARFLDETLFKGATYGDLHRKSRIATWINASDVANNTPFLFSPETFNALCSDLSKLPISEAVAASAAFPLVFSPIVLKAHQDCNYRPPDWLVAAKNNPEATSAMRAYAATLESYRDPSRVQYVKLLDGGITDNFGTTGMAVARAKAQTPYGPLSKKEAVRIRRMLFLVANAGVSKDYGWTQQVKGPGAMELAMSIVNSSMGSATRVGYDVMRLSLDQWHEDLIKFRCDLSMDEVAELRGSVEGWDCQDIKLFVGEVSADALDPAMRNKLNEIPTRLRLEPEQVDTAIAAARQSLGRNAEFNGFLASLKEAPSPPAGARRITPVSN